MSFPAGAPICAPRTAAGRSAATSPRRWRLGAEHGVAVEVRADPDLSLDLDTPADLTHPLDTRGAAGMAANDPGQPPARRPPDAAVERRVHPRPADTGLGARDRRPSRRRRVRLRRAPRQVGGGRDASSTTSICTDGSKGTWDVDADVDGARAAGARTNSARRRADARRTVGRRGALPRPGRRRARPTTSPRAARWPG